MARDKRTRKLAVSADAATVVMPDRLDDDAPKVQSGPATMTLAEFIEFAGGGAIAVPWHLGEYYTLCESLGIGPSQALSQEENLKRGIHICVSMPPQHGKPLAGDTLVTMADGSRVPIRDVRVGDRVISGFGNVANVTGHYPQGKLDVLKITTRSGRTVTAEGSHLFLVRRSKSKDAKTAWRRADELHAYDRGRWDNDWMMLGARYETDPTSSLTVDEARFLGYIAGDGGVTQRSVMFTNTDPDVVASFKRCARSIGYVVREVPNPRPDLRAQSYRANGAQPFVRKHGMMGHGAHTKRVPESVFSASRSAVAAFLAAYFECDGTRSARFNGRCSANSSFSSVSKGLLDDVRSLLARLGISSHLMAKNGRYKGKPHKSWLLSVTDDRAFFDEVPVLGAKSGGSDRDTAPNRSMHIKDCVMSVEPAGQDDCYCIMVDRDDSFLANDIVTHNTTLIAYTIAWLLFRFPHLVFGYGSYAKLFSSWRTEDIMRIYVHAGGELMKDHARKDDWRTAGGGGCLAFSPGSGIAGYQMHHIVFDDFVENEVDLDTEDKRKSIHRDMDRATQRLWPGGSIIAIATRWHPEDPIGYLLSKGYTELNLPAVRTDDDGVEHALWPDVKPLAWLDTKRLPSSKEYVGAYAWATQYQGKPVPPEGAVFGPPRWYEELPEGASVTVIGFDFGYGPEGTSDHSVAVVLAQLDGIYYVHDVLRVRSTLADMAREFKALMAQHPYPVRYGCYMGGNEKGILNLLFVEDVAIERMPARQNKFTRSQRCASAWKVGRIIVRSGQPWSAKFAREVEYFTGAERGRDDQVDALVSAFDLVETSAAAGWDGGFAFGRTCM